MQGIGFSQVVERQSSYAHPVELMSGNSHYLYNILIYFIHVAAQQNSDI
jgi:hypothetical protein